MIGKQKLQKTPFGDVSKLKIGIVVSSYYFDEITGPMLEGAKKLLESAGVVEKNIETIFVPGSYEIPYGCLSLLRKKPDAIITLGCIVKGETDHDKYIASAVSGALMQLSLQHKTPISFGVITANTMKQAEARSRGKTNKGSEAAYAALLTAQLKV